MCIKTFCWWVRGILIKQHQPLDEKFVLHKLSSKSKPVGDISGPRSYHYWQIPMRAQSVISDSRGPSQDSGDVVSDNVVEKSVQLIFLTPGSAEGASIHTRVRLARGEPGAGWPGGWCMQAGRRHPQSNNHFRDKYSSFLTMYQVSFKLKVSPRPMSCLDTCPGFPCLLFAQCHWVVIITRK